VWVVGICEVGNKLSSFGFLRGIEYFTPVPLNCSKKYFEMTLARCVFEKVHLFKKCLIQLIIHEFVSSDFSGDEFLHKPRSQLYFPYT